MFCRGNSHKSDSQCVRNKDNVFKRDFAVFKDITCINTMERAANSQPGTADGVKIVLI